MIVVGIDASNLRNGGGLTHLTELLSQNTPVVGTIKKVIIWSGKKTFDLLEDRPWISKCLQPELDRSWFSRIYWQRFN